VGKCIHFVDIIYMLVTFLKCLMRFQVLSYSEFAFWDRILFAIIEGSGEIS
jgi:hypothetical protein